MPAVNEGMGAHNIARRAAELLSHGTAAVDELGRRAGADAADALKLLDAISASSSGLMKVNVRLVPLMTSFQQQGGKRSWWRWFTGEKLEHEVFFDSVRQQIETLAKAGQEGHAEMGRQVQLLDTQYKLMATEIALLESDIEAARLLASSAYAAQRQAAGMGQDDLARLTRRIGNLESMAVATQLTREQYKVAIEHAKSISDRYREIRTLLLPLWKQSVGFDLFSSRVNAPIE